MRASLAAFVLVACCAALARSAPPLLVYQTPLGFAGVYVQNFTYVFLNETFGMGYNPMPAAYANNTIYTVPFNGRASQGAALCQMQLLSDEASSSDQAVYCAPTWPLPIPPYSADGYGYFTVPTTSPSNSIFVAQFLLGYAESQYVYLNVVFYAVTWTNAAAVASASLAPMALTNLSSMSYSAALKAFVLLAVNGSTWNTTVIPTSGSAPKSYVTASASPLPPLSCAWSDVGLQWHCALLSYDQRSLYRADVPLKGNIATGTPTQACNTDILPASSAIAYDSVADEFYALAACNNPVHSVLLSFGAGSGSGSNIYGRIGRSISLPTGFGAVMYL